MSNRPNAANIGRVDLKTSPAAKNVKPEIVSIAGNQTDSSQRDNKGSRFSSVRPPVRVLRVDDSVVGQSQTNDAEVDKNDKIDPATHDESDSSAAESLQKEKKFSGRCRLFVGNLPNDLSENDFQKFFEPFGELSEVFLNAARGFGFLRLVSMFCCGTLQFQVLPRKTTESRVWVKCEVRVCKVVICEVLWVLPKIQPGPTKPGPAQMPKNRLGHA